MYLHFLRHVLITNSVVFKVLATQPLRYCCDLQCGDTFCLQTMQQVPKGIGTKAICLTKYQYSPLPPLDNLLDKGLPTNPSWNSSSASNVAI